MRVMVTGAGGFVGSHLCEHLLTHDNHVLAVDKFSDYYEAARKRRNIAHLRDVSGFELLEADVAAPATLRRLDDVEVVYHLAGQPGVRSSWQDFGSYLRENVQCAQALLEAAAQARRPPRLVLASSSSVYGDAETYPCVEAQTPRPISPYGASKLSMEHVAGAYVQTQRLPVVVLRYFTVYGPRQRPDMAFHKFIAAMLEGTAIDVYGDGEQVRDFTFVRDVVEATTAAGEAELAPGTVLNVCGGEPVTVNAVLAALQALAGRQVRVRHLPPARGDVRRTGGSAQLAAQLLGWRPHTRLSEGLERQYEWHLRSVGSCLQA
jgi:nucleoside-diphosphate-sugar epimerase